MINERTDYDLMESLGGIIKDLHEFYRLCVSSIMLKKGEPLSEKHRQQLQNIIELWVNSKI